MKANECYDPLCETHSKVDPDVEEWTVDFVWKLANDPNRGALWMNVIRDAHNQSCATLRADIAAAIKTFEEINHACMCDKAVDADSTVSMVNRLAVNALAALKQKLGETK